MAKPCLKVAQFHPGADELRQILAQFKTAPKWRQLGGKRCQATMSVIDEFKQSIQESSTGLTLAELLVRHPQVERRTAQRLIIQMIAAELISASGEGRARRYFLAIARPTIEPTDQFPESIPLSADSKDVLVYTNQPLEAHTPVGYQWDCLEAYLPNKTWYLPEPLRGQLHKTGRTPQTAAPAGTYSRATWKAIPILGSIRVSSSSMARQHEAKLPSNRREMKTKQVKGRYTQEFQFA